MDASLLRSIRQRTSLLNGEVSGRHGTGLQQAQPAAPSPGPEAGQSAWKRQILSPDPPKPRPTEDLIQTERVSVFSGPDRLLWDGLGRWMPPSVPSFIPSFTVCDGWTELEGSRLLRDLLETRTGGLRGDG